MAYVLNGAVAFNTILIVFLISSMSLKKIKHCLCTGNLCCNVCIYTRLIYTEFHVTLISNLFFGFPESHRRFSDLTMTNETVMSSWIDGKLCYCFFPTNHICDFHLFFTRAMKVRTRSTTQEDRGMTPGVNVFTSV